MVDVCSAGGGGFVSFFNSIVLPLSIYATLATSIVIAIAYMIGQAISNPKLTLWAKTEVVQLVVSAASVLFILAGINAFCAINMDEVASIFGVTTTAPTTGVDVYTAAASYLSDAAAYAHKAMTVNRYHLEAYTVLSYLNAFICDAATGTFGWGCFFGYSGDNQQPLGGYAVQTAALNIFFNSTIISHFTALNFLFILLFVYKGFVFLFLPLGIFLRSMPYMRGFGGLLISLALAFLFVYPFLLSVLYLMGDVLVDRGTGGTPILGGADLTQFYDERVFPDEEGAGSAGQSAAAAFEGEDAVTDTYFPHHSNLSGAILFAAYAFIAAVFLPSAVLLATIASVAYIARLYGEEIDLSRITQLV